jgi:glycosyltransferase involved in cell wall biosynthesis
VLTYAPYESQVFEWVDDKHHLLTRHNVVEVEQSDLIEREIGQPMWDSRFFGQWDPASPMWRDWNARCIEKIRETYEPGDVLALIGGWCQGAIKDAFPGAQTWEFGVGYKGVMPDVWTTFEANHWRSAVRGADGWWKSTDSVVPNCYFADEFARPRNHEGYLLYIGRIVSEKGMEIVREIGRALPEIKIVAAGQGDPNLLPPNAEHVGVVAGKEKADLLAGAMATLAPTLYNEPFGGVAVEAAMSGVPPITTDWAAFRETIGATLGLPELQCTRLDDFLNAIETARGLGYHQRASIAHQANRHYGAGRAAQSYNKILDYIFSAARGEPAWYGSRADLVQPAKERTA